MAKNSDMAKLLPAILERIRQEGGKVERYAGGIWSYPGVKTAAPGRLEWHTTTPFIEELVLTQALEWRDFKKEGRYRFPTGAALKRVAAEQEGA